MSEKETTLLNVTNLRQHFPIEEGLLFKKRMGFIRAVDGINFKIHQGETLGLVGESGCGKSTTARSVARLHQPTSGEVLLNGKNIAALSSRELFEARRDLQMVFQDPYASLNPRMTVSGIISEPLVVHSKGRAFSRSERDSRVDQLMESVGLSPTYKNRYPHEFSGGQRQRIGIARALALNPKLILADEPVSALDVSIQAQILNLMVELQEKLGLAYLFIAHDLAVVKHISSRVAVMYLGKIVEMAKPDELYQHPLHPYTQALLSSAPIPDPVVEKKRTRIVLEGDVPSPDKERFGCYFYERCRMRMPRCKENIPALVPLNKGEEEHKVACFLHTQACEEKSPPSPAKTP